MAPDFDDALDEIPLTKRRKRLISRPQSLPPSPPNAAAAPSNASPVDIAVKRVSLDAVKDWPGLPRGVNFSPSDEDLLWHLLVKVGKGKDDPHPFIHQFITCLDDLDVFSHIHPEKLPGIKKDGSVSFFFHRAFGAYRSNNVKAHMDMNKGCKVLYWQETGKCKQLAEGEHQGIKKKMILWMNTKEGEEPVATNWTMHQYNLGTTTDDCGEFAVSRMFYNHLNDNNVEDIPLKSLETTSRNEGSMIAAKSVEHEVNEKCQHDNLNSKETLLQEKSSDSSLFYNCNMHTGSVTNDDSQSTSLFEANNGHEDIQSWKIFRDKASLPVSQMLRLSYECGPLSSGASSHLVNMKEVETEDACANKVSETKREANVNVNEPCSLDDGLNDGILTNSHSSLIPILHSQDQVGQNCLIQASIPGDLRLCQRLIDQSNSSTLPNLVLSSDVNVKTEPLEQCDNDNAPVVAAEKTKNSIGSECLRTSKSPKIKITGSPDGSNILCLSSSKDNALERNILFHDNSLPAGSQRGSSSHTSSTEELQFTSPNKLPHPVLSMGPVTVKSENFEDDLQNPVKNLQDTVLGPYDLMGQEGSVFNSGCNKNTGWPKKEKPIDAAYGSETQGSRLLVRRKRKKTATNSVETALEEDAPGLLQVLLDKGITVDEMKLYDGAKDDDDEMDMPAEDENFNDLESIMTKLFNARSSTPKLSIARLLKGSKAIYCVACLISLIEQTRYLQFYDSPVEWGWCRDLQSFIFVFRRHNRIVVERPEYGYATYFFELVHSLPVDWQIKRLVIVMKLANCSRTSLLENRPLLVGEDLTEAEAHILEEYGWTPNCGLGTMLNYCERVVHDKKNERFSSEWRAKIGKLLMSGHDGGRTELSSVPKKAAGCRTNEDPVIKMEY